jgi:hypothetical protein
VSDPNKGHKADAHVKKPRRHWGREILGYVNRKRYERAAKRENETPADKAARTTATATVWMALFTCLLFLVTAGTYIEIKNGGADTHDLAVAAGKQADLRKRWPSKRKLKRKS